MFSTPSKAVRKADRPRVCPSIRPARSSAAGPDDCTAAFPGTQSTRHASFSSAAATPRRKCVLPANRRPTTSIDQPDLNRSTAACSACALIDT
ncbi:hypothetical protein LK09_00820 [Microbacterium mangrovi]|uniref:Uncharacterized protein n=1 Tax=Microbacterium mangrovi TaxID=1348253 RepID=A0A0B2ADL8_9MICO|nr:hypothetical protein LK09_00820 [Microbacterium mangrovi]